jgi:hypothetical protein
MLRFNRSAPLLVLLAAAMSIGCAGCMLPLLSAIPSLFSLAHEAATAKSADEDAAAKDRSGDPVSADATPPPPPLTPDNVCQLMALARPDLVVAEFRKDSTGAPEYRDLRMQTSTESARWTPEVDSGTDAGGWRPAVNFLKMNFQPPLANAIPDSGTCYLAYSPIEPADSNAAAASQPKPSYADSVGAFSWGGRTYQYTVARSLPCLDPAS